MDTTLSVNGEDFAISGGEELLPHLDRIRQSAFAEAWLRRGLEATCLLTNRERGRAFLMFLPDDEGAAGSHGVSAEGADSGGETEFFLGNGQQDSYDVEETVTVSDGLRALEYALVNGGRADFISWHDDSI